MKYCSLQNWTLLSSPDTSTGGHCFCFSLVFSFLLELFGCFSPVAYWAPIDGEFIFQCHYLFAFSYCLWGSQGKNAELVYHSFYIGPRFARTLHHDLYVYWMGSKERRGLLLYLLHPLLFSIYKRASSTAYHGSLLATKWWHWTAIESI